MSLEREPNFDLSDAQKNDWPSEQDVECARMRLRGLLLRALEEFVLSDENLLRKSLKESAERGTSFELAWVIITLIPEILGFDPLSSCVPEEEVDGQSEGSKNEG